MESPWPSAPVFALDARKLVHVGMARNLRFQAAVCVKDSLIEVPALSQHGILHHALMPAEAGNGRGRPIEVVRTDVHL